MTTNLINALKISINNTKTNHKYTNVFQKYNNKLETSKVQKKFKLLFYYISKFHNSYFVYFIYIVYFVYTWAAYALRLLISFIHFVGRAFCASRWHMRRRASDPQRSMPRGAAAGGGGRRPSA